MPERTFQPDDELEDVPEPFTATLQGDRARGVRADIEYRPDDAIGMLVTVRVDRTQVIVHAAWLDAETIVDVVVPIPAPPA